MARADPSTGDADDGRVRFDKWLWAARFYKTRSLCVQAIDAGQARVNGDRAKPARAMRVGESVSIRKSGIVCEVVITALSDRRGSATDAALLYRGLRHAGVYTPSAMWTTLTRRVLLANVALAVVLWWLAGPLDPWLVAPWFERAVRLTICLIAGTVVYFGVLWATGLRYLELRAPA